ncbi:MAG TPA: hypothetical protein VI384_04935 [Candidatus Dormibacteraeota bacterium]
MKRQAGQVMVFVALTLPIVVLPAVAFAVDAATVAGAQARLEAATARAAEVAVQRIDVDVLRSGARFSLQAPHVALDERGATIDRIAIDGLTITLETGELVELPFDFLGAPQLHLHARATARLAVGYESPSSFLPFSVSTFCSAAGGTSICSSSSRQRWG